jgi:hypothetical protein
VLERQLVLADGQARLDGVHGHPDLAAETAGEREAGPARGLVQVALAGKRLARFEPARETDQPACDALREAEAAALAALEDRDSQVALAVEERTQVAAQVGVAEQKGAGRGRPLAERERLPLAPAR